MKVRKKRQIEEEIKRGSVRERKSEIGREGKKR